MKDIIAANELRFAYISEEGEYQFALNGVDIAIAEGSFTVILGQNGSGKSTFARLVNALQLPTEGTMLVDGMDTKDESQTLEIRKTAGMVFQNPDNQIVATVVDEDVAFGPENLGLPREEIYERIDFALQTVHMEAYKKHAPHMLSGGQKQRVAIAGVLAMKPKLIVFDEATAMLDPRGRKDILAIMRELNEKDGMTIVLITHYMEEAIDADKVLIMKDGFVEKQGTPAEVFFDTAILERAGLLPPFAAAMAMDLQKAGISIDNILTTDALVEAIWQYK